MNLSMYFLWSVKYPVFDQAMIFYRLPAVKGTQASHSQHPELAWRVVHTVQSYRQSVSQTAASR